MQGNLLRKISTKKLLYKYLASYILVLLLPLLLLGLVIYSLYFSQFKKTVENNNYAALQQAKASIDSAYVEMSRIADAILSRSSQSGRSVLVRDNTHPLMTVDTISYLDNMLAGNSLVERLFVYDHTTGYLCSNTTICTLNEFFKYNAIGQWTRESLLTDMESITGSTILPSTRWTALADSHNVLLFMFPDEYSQRKRTVFFFINEYDLSRNFTGGDGNIILSDAGGNIVYAKQRYDYFDSEEFKILLAGDEEITGRTLELAGERHMVTAVNSGVSGLRFIHTIPEAQAMAEVNAIQRYSVLAYIFVILLGSALVFLFTGSTYRPIHALREFAGNRLGRNPPVGDELQVIRESLEKAFSRNEELDTIIRSNRPAVREFLVKQILNGALLSRARANEIGGSVGLQFDHDCFRAVAMRIDAKENAAPPAEAVIEAVEDEWPAPMQGYGQSGINKGMLYFVCCAAPNTEYAAALGRILDGLSRRFAVRLTIGVGREYKSIKDVGKSFIEASAALDYRLVYGNHRVIFFEDTAGAGVPDFDAFDHTIKQLEVAILNGSISQISDIISQACRQIRKPHRTLFESRCLCYRAINAIISTMEGVNRKFKADSAPPDINELVNFETVEELETALHDLSMELCRFIRTNEESGSGKTFQDMLDFIHEHYSDPLFSIQMMSEAMNLSPSFLSHFFKKQTGDTILGYVNSLRIEQAKKALSETELTLDEVTRQIGYWNTSSFIRKFKADVGMTPGHYRRMNRTG